MSYTPPSGASVVLSWDGTLAATPPDGDAVVIDWLAADTPPIPSDFTFFPSSPYTRPAQTAANFSFPDDGPQVELATGFTSTVFGETVFPGLYHLSWDGATGYTLPAQSAADFAFSIPKTGYPEGFSSTVFGAVNAAYTQFVRPGGIASTAFGTPDSPQDLFLPATGFSTTAFGAPANVQIGEATGFGPLAIIPGAFRAVDQYAQAEGFSRTLFGIGVGYRPFAPMVNQTTQAEGWLSSVLGTPATPINALGYAEPLVPIDTFGTPSAILAYSFTLYGTPTARMTQAAETVSTGTAMGNPAAVTGGMAEAIMFTAFGQPTSVYGRLASPVARQPRFGTPKAARTGDYRAYGLNCGRRFGRPQAFNRINHPAQGLPPTLMFGTIQALQVHRARHTAPASQFGDPLLLRTPTC